MKKLMMMAVMVVTALTANAQNTQHEIGSISIQPKVGIAMGDIAGDYTYNNEKAKMRFALTAGVEGEYYANAWLGVSLGANYDQQGWKIDGQTTKLDYLNIPILANFYVTEGLALKTGIQPGFLLNSKVDGQDFNDVVRKDPETFNFAIPLGISYEYKNFVLDARTNFSLTKVCKLSEEDNWRSDLVVLTIGYKFSL